TLTRSPDPALADRPDASANDHANRAGKQRPRPTTANPNTALSRRAASPAQQPGLGTVWPPLPRRSAPALLRILTPRQEGVEHRGDPGASGVEIQFGADAVDDLFLLKRWAKGDLDAAATEVAHRGRVGWEKWVDRRRAHRRRFDDVGEVVVLGADGLE